MTGHLSLTYIRYGAASVIALGCDVGLFLLFLETGLSPAIASALGYGIGILVHWLISSRLVFTDHAAPRGSERTKQKGLFLASALVGLALTTGIVTLGSLVGLMPIFAKLIAIIISFQTTYVLRKAIVFSGW